MNNNSCESKVVKSKYNMQEFKMNDSTHLLRYLLKKIRVRCITKSFRESAKVMFSDNAIGIKGFSVINQSRSGPYLYHDNYYIVLLLSSHSYVLYKRCLQQRYKVHLHNRCFQLCKSYHNHQPE